MWLHRDDTIRTGWWWMNHQWVAVMSNIWIIYGRGSVQRVGYLFESQDIKTVFNSDRFFFSPRCFSLWFMTYFSPKLTDFLHRFLFFRISSIWNVFFSLRKKKIIINKIVFLPRPTHQPQWRHTYRRPLNAAPWCVQGPSVTPGVRYNGSWGSFPRTDAHADEWHI